MYCGTQCAREDRSAVAGDSEAPFFRIESPTYQRCGLFVLYVETAEHPTANDRLDLLSEWLEKEIDDRLFDPEEKLRLLAAAPWIFSRPDDCEIHLKRDRGFWVVYR